MYGSVLLLCLLSLSSLIPSYHCFKSLLRQTHHQHQHQHQLNHNHLHKFTTFVDHTRIQHKMTSSSTVTSSNLGTDRDTSGGESNNSINLVAIDKSNWRIIPSAAIDYQPYLDNRQEWSDQQLQDSLKLYQAFMSCTDSYVAPGIQDALNTLDHAYRLYGPESVLCSFNGGKDAVVILHLLRAAHAMYYDTAIKAAKKQQQQQQQLQTQSSSSNSSSTDNNQDDSILIPIYRPRVIYFEHAEEFPQVLDFLQDSVHDYDLDMMAFEQGVGFSDGLKILVEHNYVNVVMAPPPPQQPQPQPKIMSSSRPFPMAFCLGTRSSDPNAAGQDVFAPSSHYMPPFMRVNPILNWTYGHVWHFLRLFQLPYCCLYDEGYTSLGSTSDTLPCPALQVVASSSNNNTNTTTTGTTATPDGNSPSSHLPKFWPAYMLKDWDQERAGRIKKEKKSSGTANATTTMTTATASLVSSTVSTTSAKVGVNAPRRNKKATIPRVESFLSTVSDFRKSDPSPLLEVDTTQLELGTGTSVAGSFENTASGTTTTTNKRSKEEEEEEEGTIFTMDSLPEAYGSDDEDSDQQEEEQQRQRSLQQSPTTVGILIIGDEILKGMTLDVNTNVAAKALRKENVLLQRVVVCSDDQDEIVKDILRMIEEDKVDVIITSGGIGPTHDDVTVKSVAAALNRELVLNKEMVQFLLSKMDRNTTTSTTTTTGDGDDDDGNSVPEDYKLTDAQVKMATLPSNAKLRYFSEDNAWPILQCRNIFILPGVPQFFADKIESIATYLSSSQFERSVFYKIVLSVDEASIVDVLNRVVSKHPDVSFGSYPFVSHPEFKTVVTLEASYQQQPQPSMLLNRNVTTLSSRYASGKAIPSTAVTGTGSFVIATSSKEQRDRQVRLALDDLINQLEKGSILRVENDDLTTFT